MFDHFTPGFVVPEYQLRDVPRYNTLRYVSREEIMIFLVNNNNVSHEIEDGRFCRF